MLLASRRSHIVRHLSLPFRVFLVTASTTFAAVVTADRYSRSFEKARHADSDYRNVSERNMAELTPTQPLTQRMKTWVSENRYPIVFSSWGLSMVAAMAIVGRNRYASTQQKLVQARVYAQGLTLAVLVASFALEGNDLRAGKGRWEKVTVVDENDPQGKRTVEKMVHREAYEGEDQWMDMIEAQERKMRERGEKTRTKGKESIYLDKEGHDKEKEQHKGKGKGEGGKKGKGGHQHENKEHDAS